MPPAKRSAAGGLGKWGDGRPEVGARKRGACPRARLCVRPLRGATFVPANPERRYASLRATRGGPQQSLEFFGRKRSADAAAVGLSVLKFEVGEAIVGCAAVSDQPTGE